MNCHNLASNGHQHEQEEEEKKRVLMLTEVNLLNLTGLKFGEMNEYPN